MFVGNLDIPDATKEQEAEAKKYGITTTIIMFALIALWLWW